MKKILLILSVLFLLTITFSKAQSVSSLTIRYENPGVNNNLVVIANVGIPSSPAHRISNFAISSNDTLYLTACYYSGMLATTSTLTDTIPIGNVSIANHTILAFRMYTTFSLNNCDSIGFASRFQNFLVNTSLGIKKNSKTPEFAMHPNPATEFLILNTGKETEIKILDLSGRMIRSVLSTEKSETKIGIRDLPRGLYFLEIRTRDGISHRQKFLKE